MRACHPFLVVLCIAATAACSSDSPSAPASTGGSNLSPGPNLNSPAEGAQLSTLRPTLTVDNVTSTAGGAKVYEFEVSDKNDFSTAASTRFHAYTVLAHRSNVPEGAGGTTSFTPDFDLQPATRLFWRARMVQAGVPTGWSTTRSFSTLIAGYNRAGELYDPLTSGTTIGTIVGSAAFIAGKGIQINDQNSYVRYQLAQTIANGEFSVEIEGLHANQPSGKLKVFSMSDSTGDLLASKYLFNVQYRGLDGNPDNAISFKALFGDSDLKFEPDFGQRSANVLSLSPSRAYFWKATWSNEVRVVIQDGRGGPTIYNLGISSGGSTYAPAPHFAYLGANNGPFGDEQGSWPGAIYRNLWIGSGQRPQSLGSALDSPTQ